jgi:hypothetical protein
MIMATTVSAKNYITRKFGREGLLFWMPATMLRRECERAEAAASEVGFAELRAGVLLHAARLLRRQMGYPPARV